MLRYGTAAAAGNGIAVSLENQLPVADGSDPATLWSEGASSVLVSNILRQDNAIEDNALRATMVIYARAYAQLDDGTFVYGDVVAVNLLEVVQAIDTQYDRLNATQKTGIDAMYAKFKSLMDMWNIPNLKENQ